MSVKRTGKQALLESVANCAGGMEPCWMAIGLVVCCTQGLDHGNHKQRAGRQALVLLLYLRRHHIYTGADHKSLHLLLQ